MIRWGAQWATQHGALRRTPVARQDSGTDREIEGWWCAALQCVVMLSQDSFYRGLTAAELADVGCERPHENALHAHLDLAFRPRC